MGKQRYRNIYKRSYLNSYLHTKCRRYFDRQVQLTLTVSGNGSCGEVSDELALSIWGGAEASAGPDASICEGDEFVLTGATASNYDSITWSTNRNGEFNNIHSLKPNLYTRYNRYQ